MTKQRDRSGAPPALVRLLTRDGQPLDVPEWLAATWCMREGSVIPVRSLPAVVDATMEALRVQMRLSVVIARRPTTMTEERDPPGEA